MANGKYKALWLEGESLVVLDQTKLPFSYETKTLRTYEDAINAIKDMTVRGAGVIGNVGAFGVYLAAIAAQGDLEKIKLMSNQIRVARPTAVNLVWAVDRMMRVLSGSPAEHRVAAARIEAIRICDEDVESTEKIGQFGYEIIKEIARNKASKTVNILTHCNAGWLAIVDSGTALAPIYKAASEGIDIHVWVDETRPRNQGASLTAWELQKSNIKHTVIADNTGGLLMQYGKVDMCITGADRVTRTGDVINKIGTYLKALAAKDNHVPFYVALPCSTFDFTMTNAIEQVEIETRSADEVLYMQGITEEGIVTKVRITPKHTAAVNYAFDITNARLITGLITERGVCAANEREIVKTFKELMN